MDFQERTTGDVAIVDIQGRADRDEGAPRALAGKLRTLLDSGYKHILLNVAELAYVDSVLLGALVEGYASAIRSGGTLGLLHATKRLRDLLAMTKLDGVLQNHDSEDAAVATFAAPGRD